jgi:hypothetical protein
MATLIQSKQIQGIVTASVVTGEFLVSGSLIVTGSNSILGSVTASAISSSFIGDGSGITGITYSQIGDTPQFVGGNNITITSSSNVITVHATLDGTGTDSQNLSITGDQLTILGGNTITIPTGSGVSDYTQLTNVPSGLVSGSIQILGGSGVISGSVLRTLDGTDVVSGSVLRTLDGTDVVSGSIVSQLPSGVISGSEQLPSGVISGSDQITISESQISDLTHYTDSNVKTKLDSEGVVSGSLVSQLPSGIVSGSDQITITESQISDLDKYTDSDVKSKLDSEGVISGSSQITISESQISDLSHSDTSHLNTFTSSIQTEVDSLTAVTSSYLTEVPSGTISGSEQLPSGIISGSDQITITESQISDLDKYTDADVQTYVDSLGVVSGSVIAELPSGVISGSDQVSITESQISDLDKYTDSDVKSKLDTEGVLSGSLVSQLPSGTISGSDQITISESQISDLDKYTDSDVKSKLDSEGVVSGSYVQSLPSGTISGSEQITITESQISDLDKYTDSDVKTKLDTEGVLSGSIVSQLPSGVISGSEQLPSGTISGSSQISITESQISDLVHYTDTNVKSKLDSEGVISGSIQVVSSLPSGTISGSVQITDGSGIVSASNQISSLLPDGVISGSTYSEFSSSVSESIDALQVFSSSAYQLDSSSIDRRLDGLEGGAALYYDLSNTVWNNKYLKSGSGEISDTQNFITGNKPFKFKFNDTAKLAYEVGDIVYITNFDRDVVIHALVSSSYETGSLEAGFSILDVNGITGSTRINDSYWIVTKHSGGFITSASYGIDSASFDYRIDGIVASGSGADWDVNLYNIPRGIISGSDQITGSFATTSSLDIVSASLVTTIENVFQSSSNFDNKTLVSGSSQIDFRNITNYVADEHIDHTTVVITAGDGLDGGGNIASSREITLNVTSSHFETGVTDILTSEGVVKTSTLNTDLISTDFSQSVDSRIKGIAAGAAPAGTVSGSTQIDITQTQNYTAFSSSIATSIDGVSASPTDIGSLNTFTSSIQGEVDALIAATASYLTSETDSQTLSIDGDQLTISTGNTVTIPTGSELPSGVVSGSAQILGGSGILSGSKTDTSLLNSYTSSTDSRLSSIEAATGSYLTSETDSQTLSIDGDQLTISTGNTVTIPTGSGTSDFSELTNIPSGLISSSEQFPSGVISGSEQLPSGLVSSSFVAGTNVTLNQEGDDLYISASGGDTTYDGDRTISNDKLGDLFTDSVNPGTSGSIQEFLNAVFYPNTGPSITTGNQTIAEYTTNGSTITTITGTDPEGQAITFDTADTYTDGLVSVASNGVMTLLASPTSASFNTDLVGGSHGHKVEVTATDTFGTTTEKDIYIFVTPNSTPVFRETSTSGNVITSVTANLNENSTDDTLVKRVYFTDANGDNITIYSSSIDNNHFDVTKYSTYVDIRQNTGSLDYEQQTSYTFSISASDEHYESSEDSDSIIGLPITINVTDNLVPTLSDQTLASINENSSNGATVGSISATDNEGDTITFKNFELHQLQLDDSIVSSGSYSGTAQLTDPHENPFQMSTSGIVTRKTGVYLNSDLINEYIYRVQITDAYNNDSAVSLITINVTDDTPATLSDNWSAGPYIKESELSGTTIKTTDYGSTSADYGSDQSGTWSSSNSAISINSVGTISLGLDLSGSVTQSGDTLDSTITFTNTFGTTTTDSLSLTIVANGVPTATFSDQSSIFNSNEATNGTNLVSVSISDTESDTPYQLSIGGTDASKLTAVPQNAASSSWELQASEDLSGGTYTYDVTVTDKYSKSTTYSSRTITIAQGDTGTLGGDTTSYIIESAENGDSLRDATGFGGGNASQLSVSYTDYGSPSVQSYTSSNEAFDIDTSGNITLGLNISGSSTGSSDTISSNITFVDQFGNIGSGSLTVNVFANAAPTATFSENSSYFNSNQATGSISLVDISVSDTESDTPYVLTLSGTDASSFNVVSQNANGTSWELQPSSDLSGGTYSYNVIVTDNFSKQTTYNKSLTITQANNGTITTNGTFYIIESATNGSLIRTNSNGRTGTQGDIGVTYSPDYGSQIASGFSSNNALISVNSSGNLTVGTDISGSGNTNGSTITPTISWTDQYGNNGSDTITVNVTKNNAPTVSSTQTFNENTNQATGSSEIVRLNLTDTESDTIVNGGLSFSGYNTTYFTPSISTPQMKLLVNSTSVPAGTYPYTASIEDVHGFSTTVHSGSVTISQADDGTLGGDTTSYIIESAESGDVLRDATGYNNGNPSQLSVSYSPSYGSPSVQTYSSSNPAIVVDSSGNLTLGVDISGSVTQSGDTISSTITFTDQYGNSDTDTITTTVFANGAPAASFTSASNYESDNSISGSTAGTLTVTDTENNSPFTFILAGTDGDKFNVAGSSSPFEIQPTGSLDGGTYSINITVTDSYNESVTLTNETIVVDTSADYGQVYVYNSGQYAGDGATNYLYNLGAAEGSGTPAAATVAFDGNGFIEKIIENGVLGDTSFTYAWGGTQTALLVASGSGENLHDVLGTFSDMSYGGGTNRFFIIFPAASGMTGIPTSMTDAYAGSNVGEYVLEVGVDGTTIDGTNTIEASRIHQVTLDTAVGGYTSYYVIGNYNQISATTSIYLGVSPASGSGGV